MKSLGLLCIKVSTFIIWGTISTGDNLSVRFCVFLTDSLGSESWSLLKKDEWGFFKSQLVGVIRRFIIFDCRISPIFEISFSGLLVYIFHWLGSQLFIHFFEN